MTWTSVTNVQSLESGDTVRINERDVFEVVETGSRVSIHGDYAAKLDTRGDNVLLTDDTPEGRKPFLTDGQSGWGNHVELEKRV